MGGDRIILDSSAVSAFAEQKGRLRIVLRKAIAIGAPDGRATFQYVEIAGEQAIRWRRIGGHEIVATP